MNSRELLNRKLAGEKVERLLFCPAVYEHKARLINSSPSIIAQDVDKLAEALAAEYETYRPDVLTVGVDIYNVEAQALGAEVVFSESRDEVPNLRQRILEKPDFSRLPKVNEALEKGRIRMFVEAARRVSEMFGSEVHVRGGLSGPYSIAASLMGVEPLIMASFTDPESLADLLGHCSGLAFEFGRLYIEAGCGVCLFDSQAVPPLLSPDMFRKMILPRVKNLFRDYKAAGAALTEYVTGGDTTAISGELFETGADIILSDFSSDLEVFIKKSQRYNTLIRRNISPVSIEAGIEAAAEEISAVKAAASDNNNIIAGTGVLSCNVEPENVIQIRKILLDEEQNGR
jgi:uroporphyrinogen decarboxylase